MSEIVDLSKLPAPDVLEELDYETLLADRKAKFFSLYTDESEQAVMAARLELESEPITKLLEENAYLELLLRAQINERAKAVMLAFATGSDLDHLGALFGVERLLIQAEDLTTNPITEAEYEDDERLRTRIQMSLEKLTTAGSRGSYEYHALTASPLVKYVKVAKKPFTDGIITAGEYSTLLNFTKQKNLKLYFIIKFLGMTGARISELIRFTKQDLERGYAEMHTKGKHRRINIPKSLIEESANFFKETHHYLFINKYGNTLTERGIASLLKDYADRSGVNREVVHPHNFRHFFAIQFLKNNSNIALLADLLGHSNVNMTALYLRMSQEQQRKALDEAVNW